MRNNREIGQELRVACMVRRQLIQCTAHTRLVPQVSSEMKATPNWMNSCQNQCVALSRPRRQERADLTPSKRVEILQYVSLALRNAADRANGCRATRCGTSHALFRIKNS